MFEKMSAEQYRALDMDELEARKAELASMVESGDIEPSELEQDVDLCMAEYQRRDAAAKLRGMKVSKLSMGGGKVIDRAGMDPMDPTNSMDYRMAFRDLVASGKRIPEELRGDASATTATVGTAIPSILVNRIVESIEANGMVLAEVTRTAFAAGVVVPTSAAKAEATWVAEGAGSDTQGFSTGSITFSYYKLRCEISMSMEVGTMAIAAFESAFVAQVSRAMTVAIEKAIIAGDGTSQPKGILKETPAATITFAKAEPTYKELCSVEAAIPAEYEGTAKWFMTKKAFMSVAGITDTAGQPIARVNYGIGGRPERTILGREVVIHPYAEQMGSHFAFVFAGQDYMLNTIYDMGIQRKQDWDTEDYRTKAVMSVDGKAISADSLVVIDATA